MSPLRRIHAGNLLRWYVNYRPDPLTPWRDVHILQYWSVEDFIRLFSVFVALPVIVYLSILKLKGLIEGVFKRWKSGNSCSRYQ